MQFELPDPVRCLDWSNYPGSRTERGSGCRQEGSGNFHVPRTQRLAQGRDERVGVRIESLKSFAIGAAFEVRGDPSKGELIEIANRESRQVFSAGRVARRIGGFSAETWSVFLATGASHEPPLF